MCIFPLPDGPGRDQVRRLLRKSGLAVGSALAALLGTPAQAAPDNTDDEARPTPFDVDCFIDPAPGGDDGSAALVQDDELVETTAPAAPGWDDDLVSADVSLDLAGLTPLGDLPEAMHHESQFDVALATMPEPLSDQQPELTTMRLAHSGVAFAVALEDEDEPAGQSPEPNFDPAHSDMPSESGIDIDFSIDAVSDYRFRGVSLSNGKPAIQPGLTISHSSGLYVSAWGSNVANNSGSDVEVDLTAGFSKSVGKVELDLGMIGYLYPGAAATNYAEAFAGIGTDLGFAKIGFNLAYAPKQASIGGRDNVYIGTQAAVPLSNSPVTLVGSFGLENGAFGNDKLDWSIGAELDMNYATASIRFVDTARAGGLPGTKGKILVGFKTKF